MSTTSSYAFMSFVDDAKRNLRVEEGAFGSHVVEFHKEHNFV